MSTPCTARPGSVRSLSPVLQARDPDTHSNCSDCSICLELAAGSRPNVAAAGCQPNVAVPEVAQKKSHVATIAQSLLSPMFARKAKTKDVVTNGTTGYGNCSNRSVVQSPLLGKRTEKPSVGVQTDKQTDKQNNGLLGGDATNSSPKEKKQSKWRLKIKTHSNEDKADKCSETSSYSSLDSSSARNNETSSARTNSKRKKMDKIKKSHSRGSSFDYRLIKDMFKISLPRSRSAGEIADKAEGSLQEDAEDVETHAKEKKVKSSKSLKLKSSFKGSSKGSSKSSCNDLPDDETGLSALQGNGLVGLKNLGNTCFMNSILQCLSHTAPLREYFLSKKYRADLSGSSKMQGRLAEEFANMLTDMWSGRTDIVSPNKFKSTVAKSAPRFVGYSQQDSQEFLRFFMEGLHEDLNKGKKGKRRMEEPPKGLSDLQLADHRWRDYVTYDSSSIVNIFVGLLKSTLTCSICDHKSVTFDPFWDLSLPLPRAKGSGLNLQSCFSEFTQEEVLDGDEKPTCENCKKRQKCTKQFSIERFPPILVLHLKRFSEIRYRTKLSTKVDFPIENLDLSDFSSHTHSTAPQYDLIGVSNHSGNTFSGHYIAYCKASARWHRFSDSSVSSISKSDLVSSEAYVLFYERKR